MRRWMSPVFYLTVTLLAGAIVLVGCGDDPTDSNGNANCEVIFTTAGQGANPTTGITVINRLNGGLEVSVGSSGPGQPIVSVGSDMSPNSCEIYGLFAGLYEVSVQQCDQGVPGSSECTQTFGPLVTFSVSVDADEMEQIEVTASTFN